MSSFEDVETQNSRRVVIHGRTYSVDPSVTPGELARLVAKIIRDDRREAEAIPPRNRHERRKAAALERGAGGL